MKGKTKELTALKIYREQLKMTSADFAKALGISASLYYKVERGFRAPSREFITRLKQVFPEIDTNIFFSV